MATTTTTQRVYRQTIEPNVPLDVDNDVMMDNEDSRSSSLSDVDDAQDELPMTSPNLSSSQLDAELDEDSEAETERLEELTPKARRGTLSDGKFSTGKTSSALSKELQVDSDIEEAPSPLVRARDIEVEEGLDPLDSLASIATSIAEQPQLKRKRSSSDGSELSDIMDIEEPVRKRSHSQHDVEEDEEEEDETEERVEDAVEDDIPQDEEIEDEPDKPVADANGDEAVLEELPASRPSKGRRGKRKGKKLKDADIEAEHAVDDTLGLPDVEGDEGVDGEAGAEVDDTAAADEELTRKKDALDGMSGLERHFVAWRKNYLTSEAAEIEKEMQLLEGPIYSCKHPDFLARRAAIDGRRDEKIQYEDTFRDLKREQEHLKLVAGRQQIGSQYFQSVRQVRDTTLEECNRHIHAVQRDRRRWGADERNHLRMFVPNRRQQVKDQTKYNKEVSILSGVARYHGMPAAPAMKPLSKDFAEDDFRNMGLNIQPVQQRVVSRQPTIAAPTNAHEDRTEAAAQFYEQTPWANPMHPSHQQNPEMSHYYNPVRASSSAYNTPLAQHRTPIGPNGSASTIEAASSQQNSTLDQHSRNVLEQSTSRLVDDTPSHSFRRVNSGAHSQPPANSRREAVAPEANQTHASHSAKPFGIHPESSVSQPFPTSALHMGESPRDRETERPPGLLGQRPFAVGVDSGRLPV